jgi:DNA-directed RNA polymerase specialized sigma24 family protein
MAQDYSARLDLLDLPHWRTDEPGDGSDPLREASANVWPRILGFARRELADKVAVEERKVLTLEAWEDTLLSVAETLRRHRGKESIKDLEGFLVGTFQHRLSRVILREKNLTDAIEFLPSTEELAELRNARDEDWATNLENELLVKELLRRMDEWTRTVWLERRYGFSWKKIAKHLGMTVQQVKMRFRYNMEKLRREIDGENRGEEPPLDENDKP